MFLVLHDEQPDHLHCLQAPNYGALVLFPLGLYGCMHLCDTFHQALLEVPTSLTPSTYQSTRDYIDFRVTVPSGVLTSLAWWSNLNRVMVGIPFRPPMVRGTIVMEASLGESFI